MNKPKFLNEFFSNMKKLYSKNYTQEEKRNFSILYDMLEDRKTNKVKVADLPMADGKSQFILFYCQDKYLEDENFSAIVVKRTLKECEDFCIKLGLKEDVPENIKEADKKEIYYGERGINSMDKKFYYKKEPQVNFFKAIAVKGFNFKDCMLYDKPVDVQNLEKQKKLFGNIKIIPKDFEGEYKIGICNKCKQYNCPVKVSKEKAKEHRIIAISHARLFLLNSNEEFLEDLLYFKKENDYKKRQLLIIDEKIQIVDINSVKMREFIELKEYVTSKKFNEKINNENKNKNNFSSDISKIIMAIKELAKIDVKQEIIKVPTKSIPKMQFSEEFEFFIAKNKPEYNNAIQFLKYFQEQDTFLASDEYVSKSEEKREFTTYRYIDISTYSNKVDNAVLLDATASMDIDYKKSDFDISEQIKKSKKKINLFLPTNECNLSKSNLTYLMLKKKENFLRILAEINHLLNSTDKKTLIVTYKSILPVSDFKEYLEKHLDIDLKRDKVIHFGQYTTGVNHLSDYENIIFLGELMKAPVYYKAKLLALDLEENEENIERIKLNEFLVDVVQQIGRTSYRKGIAPNVYIFDKKEVLDYYKDNLKSFFELNEEVYDNKQMCFFSEGYNMSNRGKGTIYYRAISYMAYKIEEDFKETGIIADKYTFKNKDIKEAIGYSGNKFSRDIVEPLQKSSSNEFLIYNAKERTITLNIPVLEKVLR